MERELIKGRREGEKGKEGEGREGGTGLGGKREREGREVSLCTGVGVHLHEGEGVGVLLGPASPQLTPLAPAGAGGHVAGGQQVEPSHPFKLPSAGSYFNIIVGSSLFFQYGKQNFCS